MKRYTKLILLMSIFCLIINNSFAQANAGEDKTICNGSSVQIGTTGSGDNCYKWSPETGLDDPTSPTPIASPTTTTTYTLTCTKTDLSSKSMDAVVVTVETPMVELTIENNITECMEGRSVTFTATASEEFEDDTPIEFTFNYEHPDGTPWTSVDWSFDLTLDNTIVIEDVADGDMDHEYDINVFVEVESDDCMATSVSRILKVFELWIEYFKDNTSGKDWKVVVGNNIAYKAIASSHCTNWNWDLGSVWNPTGGNAQIGTGMIIPNSDLPNDNDWNHFGDTYGIVNVLCEDGEGNIHQFLSTSMNPSNKAKVFFNALETNNPEGVNPNWFYYWKEFIPWGLIELLTYNSGLSGYASTNPIAASTQVSPLAQQYNDETTHRGIHTFYETLAHESHHITLWNGWWGAGNLPDPSDDIDGDSYPDSWETSDPEAIIYGFAVPQNDDYSSGVNIGTTGNSAGYNYEEDKCRAIEHALMETAHDNKDWSFDPTSSNQGKQWD